MAAAAAALLTYSTHIHAKDGRRWSGVVDHLPTSADVPVRVLTDNPVINLRGASALSTREVVSPLSKYSSSAVSDALSSEV